MSSPCCNATPITVHVDRSCADPLSAVPEYVPGRCYNNGQWVSYYGGGYISTTNNNSRNPYDRTVWAGPYTVLDLLGLLAKHTGCGL